MPILRSLPPWPNPQESIGRQIPSSRVGNRMVWWPRGPALETFEKDIQPEIDNNLKSVDLGHVELFIRLYMIGRKPETANPIIMVCCTNSKARKAAEGTIRESGLLDGHKGFGLGGAALPLEHPAPVRPLSPTNQGQSPSGGHSEYNSTNISSQLSSSTTENLPCDPPVNWRPHLPIRSPAMTTSLPCIINPLPSPTESNSAGPVVFASSMDPLLGRRIFTSNVSSHASHQYATAGVVIRVGENQYQMTVGHLFEGNSKTFDEEEPRTNLDECHFDGQSDDEEQNSDYKLELTGRGSATPEDDLSLSRTVSTQSGSPYSDLPAFSWGHETKNTPPPEKIQSHVGIQFKALTTLPIGYLPRGRSFRGPIDYAIIAVPRDCLQGVHPNINIIIRPHLDIKDVGRVGREERNIVVATYSRIIEGVLISGKVTYSNHHAHLEQLAQVILGSEVFEGDSGSPVLDSTTGSLYGHIVMGVPGTKVAYIVQAFDVFRDIETRMGQPVSIVTQKDRSMIQTSHTYHIWPSSYQFPFSHSEDTGSQYSPRRSQFSNSSAESSTSTGDTSSQHSSRSSNCDISNTSTSMALRSLDDKGSILPCEFVGCGETFDIGDLDGWIEHFISVHLKDNLPEKALCWFCDDWIFDTKNIGDRRKNFENRMRHIYDHISHEGMTSNEIRPDHFMNTHLYNHGLITENIYTLVRRCIEISDLSQDWILPYKQYPGEEVTDSREYEHKDPL
ncbi:hypothetical protein F4859DRAFT_80863 [Xylaria cf. heliscus]|nr:hypothetical protein F4859DRAFT_80863 [Xylaria cf. heliscus]